MDLVDLHFLLVLPQIFASFSVVSVLSLSVQSRNRVEYSIGYPPMGLDDARSFPAVVIWNQCLGVRDVRG